MTDAASISVCVVCRNEADKLDACLESVAWADEILVMDLESSDGSAEVAERHGATVVRREPIPIVEPLRDELAARARGEWILALDPDERVSPGLAEELRSVAARDDVDLVEIPFTHWDFGYPPSHRLHRFDPKPRFYRRARVSWPVEPNTLPTVAPERLHRLPSRDELVIVHDRNRTVAEAIDRALRYAPAEARARIDAGETFTARRMLRRLAQKSRRQFVEARAFDDGVPGVVRAATLVAFDFYVWAAFWQMSGAKRTPEDDRYVRKIGRAVDTAWTVLRAVRTPLRVARRRRADG
ncbi:MAG: glycosyltransferase [Actinomycetota bacterium]|nr:glycosyltransferase [Actinomycetota bacterium]